MHAWQHGLNVLISHVGFNSISPTGVAKQLNSGDVLERLAWLMVTRNVANHIRGDNGPEFTAKTARTWPTPVGVETLFIEPVSPRGNSYVELFNGKLADELMAR